MRKRARMIGCMDMTGIGFLVWMLASICAYGTQTPSAQNGIWLERDFFRDWRELVDNLAAAKRSDSATATETSLADEEFGYQHTMLMPYQTTILIHAVADQSLPGPTNPAASFQPFSAHLSPDSQENIAAWKALWSYPKAIKDALAPPEQKPATRAIPYTHADDDWWNIRALLKRWGVPKPSKLILIGIGLYLLLALLSRR